MLCTLQNVCKMVPFLTLNLANIEIEKFKTLGTTCFKLLCSYLDLPTSCIFRAAEKQMCDFFIYRPRKIEIKIETHLMMHCMQCVCVSACVCIVYTLCYSFSL